ncbi:MAG: hypothetical protein M3Z54_09530 [Gemmatimonadota bacterium]|nr:hypothetical protein [Gemmatimonadota bacterium]
MAGFAIASIWGAFVLAALVGWGFLVAWAFAGSRRSQHWSRLATLGFAFSACLGGALDFLAVISRWLVCGFLAAGFAAFLYRRVQRSARAEPVAEKRPHSSVLAVPFVAVVTALLLLRVAGSVSVLQPSTGMQNGSFNTYDDFPAYVVYPLKMLDAGSLGSDPFSLRRTPTHALGGNAFLQTFILAALRVQNLRILDVGLGTILVVGLLWGYMARLRLGAVATTLVIGVFLAIPPPLANVTAVLLPIAFFLSLFWLFAEDDPHISQFERAASVGVHVGAICVLKSSLIPAALGFAGAQWVLGIVRSSPASRRGVIVDGLGWIAAIAIAVLPWLLDARRWTGTFLLGDPAAYHAQAIRVAGFHAVTGARFLITHLKELPRLPYVYTTVLAAFVLASRSRARVPNAFWSLLAAAAIGTLAVTLAGGGAVNELHRYMYSFAISALMVSLVYAVATAVAVRTPIPRALALAGLSLATGYLVLSTEVPALRYYQYNLSSVLRSLRGEQLVAPELAAKYRQLQQAIPENALFLECMGYPFLFDFRRNRILVDDQPGSASPAPGQPFFAGADTLANYLLASGVQYVAYDYATPAILADTALMRSLAADDRHPVAQAVARMDIDFRNSMLELSRTRRRIFDDGSSLALDLRAREQ